MVFFTVSLYYEGGEQGSIVCPVRLEIILFPDGGEHVAETIGNQPGGIQLCILIVGKTSGIFVQYEWMVDR